MNDSSLREILKSRLAISLPGEEVQLLMAPDFRKPISFYVNELPMARIAAVMILIFRADDGQLSTVLIKRKDGGIHASQIALPGGSTDSDDASIIDTALRETQEEISAIPENIEVLGTLSPLYIPPSRFHVTPVVGWYNGPIQFLKSEDEISELYITPLSIFLQEEIKFTGEFMTHTGIPTKAPAYRLGSESMWGATAMIFSEFTEVYRDLI